MDRRSFILFLMLAGALLFTGTALAQDAVPRLTKEVLKASLGSPDLVVIDARGVKTGSGKERVIKGAVAEDPSAPEKWAGRYSREKTLVIYCA